MPIPAVVIAVASLAALAALLPRGPRMLVELGAATLALGYAALAVAYQLPLGSTPASVAVASLPTAAARMDAALVLLGAVLPLGGALLAWREWKWKAMPVAPLAAGVAAWQLLSHAPRIAAAGVAPVLGTALVVAAVLALAGVALRRLARPDAPIELTAPPLAGRGRILAWSAIAFGSALALFAPHTLLVFGGAVIAAVGADALGSSTLHSRLSTLDTRLQLLPWRSLVVAGCLGYVTWLLVPIAGPIGLGHATLADVPVSAAAAALLTPPLAIAALVLAAPFPLSRARSHHLLAPVAAALLVRTALPLFATGLDGWRTLLLPAGVLLALLAAITGRPASLIAAAAWCAGLSAEATGAAGAMLLALALPIAAFASAGSGLSHTALRALAAAVAGAGAVFALDGLLRVEVFYAVLLWLAWVLLALRGTGPGARVYSRD